MTASDGHRSGMAHGRETSSFASVHQAQTSAFDLQRNNSNRVKCTSTSYGSLNNNTAFHHHQIQKTT